jgi:PhnB protein
MGFKEGFTIGLENLDQYIAAQFYLRKQKKPNNQPRVSTYVNFPGNTEEAFHFYRSVFQTEFVGGIQRFNDVPADPSQPPMPENLKKMVLHVELPLLGNHILMGTDAPKEMGFTVTKGNNMHINLEPDTRAEADRIFNALSEGGVVEMPLQDMFWGAYFGSFADKFGINWMVNCRSDQD